MSAFGKIASVLFAVFIFFFLPLFHYSNSQDLMNQLYVQTVTERFVDAVRCTGEVSQKMYLLFLEQLQADGNLYQVNMEHSYEVKEASDTEEAVFTTYNLSLFDQQIMEQLWEEPFVYQMARGDYFMVQVNTENETYSQKIQKMLYGKAVKEYGIYAFYGGRIRDEAYRRRG